MGFARAAAVLMSGAVAALALVAAGPDGERGERGERRPLSLAGPNVVIQTFPSNDVMRTAWKVHWATVDGFGLYLRGAWFKKGPAEPWLQVLGDARLAEMFVLYHAGTPRFGTCRTTSPWPP